MEASARADAAHELLACYASKQPTGRLSDRHPDLRLEDAYAIQQLQTQARIEGGAAIRGRKVGLTSAAMRLQMKVDQPDFGVLLDTMMCSEDSPVAVAEFLQPRVEPEVAFVLRRPLVGPGVSAADAVRAVDFVLPALEIIDSRIKDWDITFLDTVADNASSGGYVLGDRPRLLHQLDLRMAGCQLLRDGRQVATGAGGAVLGSPILSLAWLANTLADFGEGLDEGQVVLPGSITASMPVAAGSYVTAVFADMGSVSVEFV